MKHKHVRGFTIVELLIVIVVISILATVTVVAFNGVTQSAQDANRRAAVRNIKQGIHLYLEETGLKRLNGGVKCGVWAGYEGLGFGDLNSSDTSGCSLAGPMINRGFLKTELLSQWKRSTQDPQATLTGGWQQWETSAFGLLSARDGTATGKVYLLYVVYNPTAQEKAYFEEALKQNPGLSTAKQNAAEYIYSAY